MKNRILLFKNICFARNLSSSQAVEALKKAEASRAARYYSFYISSSETDNTWALCGEILNLRQVFLEEPESFSIELEEKSSDKPSKKVGF